MPGKVLGTYLIQNKTKHHHFGVSTGALYIGHYHPLLPLADFCLSGDIKTMMLSVPRS